MTKEDGIQSSTKQRRSRKTNTANQQNGKQARAAQRPAFDVTEGWKTYWEQQGQPWRTEPEIDEERQKYLNERRSIEPDIKLGIYPFKDIKLSRADVEWLLATLENRRGAVDWKDESQREREGLDLRGANLRQENLADLPLARMRGGLTFEEWEYTTEEQLNMAAAQLQKANLEGAQLQGAILGRALLQGATLFGAQLQGANLEGAQLQKARLTIAQLQGANLGGAQLQRADLGGAQLQRANLGGAQLQEANLVETQLQGADLRGAQLDSVRVNNATLSDERHRTVLLADIKWGEVNLAVVDWGDVTRLGDEQVAQQEKDREGKIKDKQTRLDEYKEAVRANRQLAVVLRDQGLNEEADHFAYRAQILQRVVLRRQRKFGRYLFFGFLDILAGYGYRPGRSVFWYLAIVCGFALAYHLLGQLSFFPPDAFVYSLTSFHGRGFFPGLEHRTSLHDPLIMLAALEAVVGLFIEISFIATFTQRFFGR